MLKNIGVTYKTAWNWFKAGSIEGIYQLPSRTVIVPEKSENTNNYGVILYARTSSSQNKDLLGKQSKRLEEYVIAKGYKIKQIIKEFSYGLNDNRKLLSQILKEGNYDKIIVEHKDRLTRFGFNYIQILTGGKIEVINESKEEDEDVIQDLISIIHCFFARFYGFRRSKILKIKIKEAIKDIEKE